MGRVCRAVQASSGHHIEEIEFLDLATPDDEEELTPEEPAEELRMEPPGDLLDAV